MSGAATTLAIDLWHTRLAAALRTPDGRVTPLAIDGAAVIPTGVTVTADGALHAAAAGALLGQQEPQSYVRIPGQRLHDEHIFVGNVQVDPVDAVAAVLSTVADAAGWSTAPKRVVIATPAGWTTRQHVRLRAAAAKAGLGEPELVNGAEAIVQQMTADLGLAVGQVVAVVRLDTTVGDLAVLRREPDGYRLVAAIDLGELGEVPGATLVDQTATALADALDAAGMAVDYLGAVVCDAPPGMVPNLATALTAVVGAAPPPVRVGELAAALGAVNRAGSTSRPPVDRGVGWGLVRAGVTGTGAFAIAGVLTVQQMESGTVYDATSTSPTLLVLQWYGWGLAPVFAVLGVVAFACFAADLRFVVHRSAPVGPTPGLGAGLMTAAATGIIAATALGILGAANYGVVPAPLLRWTLLSTAPLAAILIALGIVVTRAAPPSGTTWTDLLHPPMAAVFIGGVSAVVLIATYTAVPRIDSDLWWTTEHLAAFGLGWAVALLVTAEVWRRILLGALLSAGATYAIDITTATAVATCLIIAITVWAAARLSDALWPTAGQRIDTAATAALTPPTEP